MNEVMAKIKKNQIKFKKNLDPRVKALITRILKVEPRERPTCQEILESRQLIQLARELDSVDFLFDEGDDKRRLAPEEQPPELFGRGRKPVLDSRKRLPQKSFKKQKTACIIGQAPRKRNVTPQKQIMNISEFLDQKRGQSPQPRRAPQAKARSRLKTKRSEPKRSHQRKENFSGKRASGKGAGKRSGERGRRPGRRIEIIRSPPIKKKVTNWLRREERSGKWVRQAQSPDSSFAPGIRPVTHKIILNSPPPRLTALSRPQTPLKHSLKATIRATSKTGAPRGTGPKKGRSQVTRPKSSVSPQPTRKRESQVTLSRLKKNLLTQKKDGDSLYGSVLDRTLEKPSYNLSQYRSCQHYQPVELGDGSLKRAARKENGRAHRSPEPQVGSSQLMGYAPSRTGAAPQALKCSLKKSKTQNYSRNAEAQAHRKVIKYSLKEIHSSEQQFSRHKQHMKSVEVAPRALRGAPFQKWPSWKHKVRAPVKEKRPGRNFNPFVSQSPKTSELSLMSTLPTPLAPTHSLHSKVGRMSTHSSYSLQFPQKASFVLKNDSLAQPSARIPFGSSSFHAKQFSQASPFGQEKPLFKKAQSYFHTEDPPSELFKMDAALVRTISDPFNGEERSASKLSSQNALLFSGEANLSLVSSPNATSDSHLPFAGSVMNDSRHFNLISPNNLIMMPLGSISNETRVNIYSQSEHAQPPGTSMTGRREQDLFGRRADPKSCFTSLRQGISGNSLTELLTGLRPKPQTDLLQQAGPRKMEYGKMQSSKLQKPGRPAPPKSRAKVAKSQPKLRRYRSNTLHEGAGRAGPVPSHNNYFRVQAAPKPGAAKEKKLLHPFKKQSKENKAPGTNHRSHFKKKRSRANQTCFSRGTRARRRFRRICTHSTRGKERDNATCGRN